MTDDNIPDRLPVLACGKQPPGNGKLCAEQFVDWLVSGMQDLGDHTDHPSCVHPVLNAVAIAVNDALSDENRPRMAPLLLRQPGTAMPGLEPGLSLDLARWAVRRADEYVTADEYVAAPKTKYATKCVERATTWLAQATKDPFGPDTDTTLNDITVVARYATGAVWDAVFPKSPRILLQFLSDLQDEHARLTGFTPTPIDADRYALGVELLGAVR
jgi:hypothetical protein